MTTSTDDWKGEAHIRRKPKDGRKEATKLVNIIYHQNRRAAGLPPAGQKQHRTFVLAALAATHAKRE